MDDKKFTPFCEEPENAAMALERKLNKTMAVPAGTKPARIWGSVCLMASGYKPDYGWTATRQRTTRGRVKLYGYAIHQLCTQDPGSFSFHSVFASLSCSMS